MDRSVTILQRIEERVDLLEESIRKRLVLVFVLITFLQSLVLPFFFKRN